MPRAGPPRPILRWPSAAIDDRAGATIAADDADPRRCRGRARGRMHVPCRSLPPAERAALRPLLPLHVVPARERRIVRAQRDDRVRSGRAARRRSGTRRDAVGKRRRAADRTLPALPGRGLEPLRRRRRRGSLRPRRHPRRARRGCRPTSTSSRRRSSRGSSSRRKFRRCPSTTTQSDIGRPRAWPGARRFAHALAGRAAS